MISGEITVIKGVTKESASLIYEWVNREDLRSLTGTVYPVSEYEHEDWVKKTVTSTDKKLFLICDKQSGESIGTIGLKNFDNVNRNAELFISIGNTDFLSSAGNKRGYGTDAVSALVKFCFNRLNLHKVYLRVYESNTRAIRCYEKVGFKREGMLREHHFSNGKYEDVVFMGIVSGLDD